MTQTVLIGTQSRVPNTLALQRILVVLIALLTLPPLFYFCGDGGMSQPPPVAQPPDADEPDVQDPLTGKRSVYFVSPEDDAEVRTAFTVILGAENFTIEAAKGSTAIDRGHFHLMIDNDCLSPGEKMIPDSRHLDLAEGEKEVSIELMRGQHHLCLQAATGEHVALEHTAHIHLDVVE